MFALALLSALVAQDCDGEAQVVSAPPPVLSPALAQRYPNGIDPWQAPSDKSLLVFAQGWQKKVVFASPAPNCSPAPVRLDNQDFFPPSSGAVGTPLVVAGVDFGNRKYSGGPGNCTNVTLANNTFTSPDGYEAYVQEAFLGKVAGSTVAVVVLRCEYNGHGFDSEAQVFEIASGTARQLGTLGDGSMTGPDSPFPPWPGGWIHVSFQDDRLYADVWDREKECDRHADWVSTAYTLRGGKLVSLGATRHHRMGIPLACDQPPPR